jgi:hypothetical protein
MDAYYPLPPTTFPEARAAHSAAQARQRSPKAAASIDNTDAHASTDESLLRSTDSTLQDDRDS